MSLAMVENGKRVRLLGVKAGCELRSRLSVLGLIPGVEIEMIQNLANGPVVIGLNGSRLMLGRGMAQKIIVR
ncbi:MAG: FeoA family protein [Dissulfurimicrobium sp.]|uniref:FeoA family protein n=1 Tax=Dissulfurimicrobium TaxID=1769732 RepID=UPI003C779C49